MQADLSDDKEKVETKIEVDGLQEVTFWEELGFFSRWDIFQEVTSSKREPKIDRSLESLLGWTWKSEEDKVI